MPASAGRRVMNVMGGIDGAAVSTAKSGAAHCWALVLIVADCRAPFDAEIHRTSCSYGMYSPIWDVLGAPGGAG